MRENMNIFDFALDDTDISTIRSLDEGNVVVRLVRVKLDVIRLKINIIRMVVAVEVLTGNG